MSAVEKDPAYFLFGQDVETMSCCSLGFRAHQLGMVMENEIASTEHFDRFKEEYQKVDSELKRRDIVMTYYGRDILIAGIVGVVLGAFVGGVTVAAICCW